MNRLVRVEEIPGGMVVYCRLCGKKFRKQFMASDTNYAEARRLATAYHWEHEHSDAHKAAVAVFFSAAAPPVSDGERLLHEIFGEELPSDRDLRRRAARRAAETTLRASKT